MTQEPLFLIWSNEHGAWWKPGSHGYTLDHREAGRYSAEAARGIVDQAGASGPFGPDVPNEVMVLAAELRWHGSQ